MKTPTDDTFRNSPLSDGAIRNQPASLPSENDLWTLEAAPDVEVKYTTPVKVILRLIPFLCILYIFNILDRSNVGYARLTMQDDLKMSEAVFEFGYGIFYIGYLAFEVPANLLLRRIGARRWLARIMITWGVVSCATMFVVDSWSFYAVRILLGVAEAGFFPGIILYLTYWFPARERARMTALFMLAIAFSGVFGNPLSGVILQYLHGTAGLKGWQWLFLIEGLPSVVLGFAVLFVLPDGPQQARWLNDDERNRMLRKLASEDQARRNPHSADFLQAMISPRVWLLIALYFTVAVGANAAGAHVPKILAANFEDFGKARIGLLAAIPHLCAVVGMTLLGFNSDRTGERRGHVSFAAFLASAGWVIAACDVSPWLTLAGLSIAQMGMMSMLPPFWAIPTAFLSGAAAAGGIALINSVANIGGFFGPRILGAFGLWSMAGILCAGGILALCVHQPRERLS